MGTVTAVFARALVQAAGLRFAEDGSLFNGDILVRKLSHTKGNISDTDYFDLVDWVRVNSPDRVGLPIAYARAVDIDNLGTLGLAIKTAPKLRDSLKRVERYFRLLTDTVSYQLDETSDPALFTLKRQTQEHPALHLRNECALCGFGRIFKEFVGTELSYERVTFRHHAEGDVGRYEEFFGCPVHFDADWNAIVLRSQKLDLPTRLGDAAVSIFLKQHLDTELGTLNTDDSFEHALAEYLSEALSNGIPTASAVARALGMSERTLFRRLSEKGLTYQDVLERTQNSLAENLLSQSAISITDVAFLTGFSDQSSFSRAFKRWVGQTPGAYRKAAT
jgi:AraC-like DNA-binding protein